MQNHYTGNRNNWHSSPNRPIINDVSSMPNGLTPLIFIRTFDNVLYCFFATARSEIKLYVILYVTYSGRLSFYICEQDCLHLQASPVIPFPAAQTSRPQEGKELLSRDVHHLHGLNV